MLGFNHKKSLSLYLSDFCKPVINTTVLISVYVLCFIDFWFVQFSWSVFHRGFIVLYISLGLYSVFHGVYMELSWPVNCTSQFDSHA